MKRLLWLVLVILGSLRAESSKQTLAVDPGLLTDVCNSFNRPMQLYAHLKSVRRHIPELTDINVIYRADKEYEAAYEIVKASFPEVKFFKQGASPSQDYKPLTMQCAFGRRDGYLMFSVDDIIVTYAVDLGVCLRKLEETKAYCVHLRLGKNIIYCYATRSHRSIATAVPVLKDEGDGMFSWRFGSGRGDWRYQNSMDMAIYRKADVYKFFSTTPFKNPHFECAWNGRASNRNRRGLCFGHSKIVNIPTNIVTQYGKNRYAKNGYSPQTLLDKFNEGYEINIDRFSHIDNQSPHEEHDFEFIKRHPSSSVATSGFAQKSYVRLCQRGS